MLAEFRSNKYYYNHLSEQKIEPHRELTTIDAGGKWEARTLQPDSLKKVFWVIVSH